MHAGTLPAHALPGFPRLPSARLYKRPGLAHRRHPSEYAFFTRAVKTLFLNTSRPWLLRFLSHYSLQLVNTIIRTVRSLGLLRPAFASSKLQPRRSQHRILGRLNLAIAKSPFL